MNQWNEEKNLSKCHTSKQHSGIFYAGEKKLEWQYFYFVTIGRKYYQMGKVLKALINKI